MERAIWKPARLLLLAGILGSSLWVLSRAIAAPKAEKAQQPNYSLPNSVPLKGWNLQASTALSRTSGLPAGQQYQYRQQTDLLDIEARILLTDGNVSRLLSVNTPLQTANRDLQV
jgi:hemolysin activation/secretion protein